MVEQVTITTEDYNPSLEEQAAAQDAAADAPKGEGEGTEKILGKFNSVDELIESYTQLEKRLGSSETTQEAPAESEGEKQETEQEAPADGDEARETVENAGLDFDALTASYYENGSLTEENYAELEAAGIPKAVVDQFIAGQEAQAALIESRVFETVGGADEYASMTAWAESNLTPQEIEIYNREVNSGDEQRIMFAVKGLKAQYASSNGFEPSRQISGKPASAKASGFGSWAQVQAAMSDPRYQTDPAYRQDVERRLAVSSSLK